MLATSSHPKVALFHIAFKLAAMVCYVFFGVVSSDTTIMYIIVISLCACDFWTVKNVTGRLLVGLRWWSTIEENGKETWHFESIPDRSLINSVDKKVFWTGQYLFGGLWIFFAFINFFSFNISNLTVCSIGAVLCNSNTMGYIKCDKSHRQGVSKFFMKKAANNLSMGQMASIGSMAANAGK